MKSIRRASQPKERQTRPAKQFKNITFGGIALQCKTALSSAQKVAGVDSGVTEKIVVD